MKKTVSLSRLACAALALLASQAHAITWGTADGTKHPEVAALVDYDSKGTAYAFCTGTLISPTVLLTAAHCNPGVPMVKVTFESHVDNAGVMYVGHYIAHPGYDKSQSDPHDIAVVVFDHPIDGIAPARLPAAGYFDALKKSNQINNSRYTAVGYGGQERSFDGQGKWVITYQDTREWSVSSFDSLNNAWLRLSQNAATGNGGTCYGDSGGPNFIGADGGETRVLAGTTITGDSPCVSRNVIYRLDTQSARDFLKQFVTLP